MNGRTTVERPESASYTFSTENERTVYIDELLSARRVVTLPNAGGVVSPFRAPKKHTHPTLSEAVVETAENARDRAIHASNR